MLIFRLFTAQVKVHQIPHVIFKQKVSFSSKFGSFFSVMSDNSSAHFRLKLYVLLVKAVDQSANFQTSKFTKFLMSFLDPRGSFSLNFASLFSAMRHNASLRFHLNICMLWTNGSK